jgi:predicted deacetylase
VRRVNISIDDVSPHPHSSIRVIDQCMSIIDAVPSAKFTLFVPTAYWRSVPTPPISVCPEPLLLRKFPDFCRSLRDLPAESFEIGFHGHFHGIPGKSNNDELRSVNLFEARQIYDAMLAEVTISGLRDVFKPILRPPAWRLSPDAFDAALDFFDLLALNSSPTYTEIYAGKQDSEEWKSRIVYQGAAPPIIDFPEKWEDLEVVTHACEWDKNYLSPDLAKRISDLMVENSAVGAFIGEFCGQV